VAGSKIGIGPSFTEGKRGSVSKEDEEESLMSEMSGAELDPARRRAEIGEDVAGRHRAIPHEAWLCVFVCGQGGRPREGEREERRPRSRSTKERASNF
jgi:hypothetical protein